MIYFVCLMAHTATAYLHFLLAWRFYPKRQDSYFVQLFWYLMLHCVAMHTVYSAFYLAHIFAFEQAKAYAKALGYALLVFYPAILATLFLGELKVKPVKPNALATLLSGISRDTRTLFKGCLVIAALTLIVPLGLQSSFDLQSYSLGNTYALAFLMLFSGLWGLMYLSGLRASRENTQSNSTKFDVIAIAILLLLSLAAYFTDAQHAWNFIPIISTIGLSLSFCWYRFRTQFMDVILNQFLRILILVGIAIVVRFFGQRLYQQAYATEIELLLVFVVMLLAFLLFYVLDNLLQSLWQPNAQRLTAMHRELPVLLQECTTPDAAIAKTEHYLAQLFSTQVRVNQPLTVTVQVVTIEGDPELKLHLNYMRHWLPWFSEALNWVQIAGLYLQSHIKVLDALAKEHVQKSKAQEFAKLAAKAELMAMQSQIRPHFLFNCLNSIHAFISSSPTQAETMIESLATLIRGVLQMSAQDEVALCQELALVEHYIHLEKMRYGDRFEFKLAVAAGCALLKVPAFSIQPLVENAIKHAVDAQFEPVTIQVAATSTEQQLVITVTDNGPGLSGHGSSGLGIAMQNIENRLKNLYGNEGCLTLKNAGPKGAMAMLHIPIQVEPHR
jgi:signal transduction histidine kinase